MNRLPGLSMHSTIALLYAMQSAEPAPTVVRAWDVLPLSFHDNEKIRAAEAKRARRAAKRMERQK